jgi:hypothetical protein
MVAVTGFGAGLGSRRGLFGQVASAGRSPDRLAESSFSCRAVDVDAASFSRRDASGSSDDFVFCVRKHYFLKIGSENVIPI